MKCLPARSLSGDNPLLIINDRLLNNPVPPREIDPSISPQLQEIIYRALERDPAKALRNAHEMVWDLQHLDRSAWPSAVNCKTGTAAFLTAKNDFDVRDVRDDSYYHFSHALGYRKAQLNRSGALGGGSGIIRRSRDSPPS